MANSAAARMPGGRSLRPDHVLTWRQRKILQAIRNSVQRRGYPPSIREIAEAVGLTSVSSVSHQLTTLQRKGYLHRDTRRPRTMEVRLPGHAAVRPDQRGEGETAAGVPRGGPDVPSREAVYVPLVDRIAAGAPILADKAVEDVFPLPRQLVGKGPLFLLKMTGDSMIDAAIADGDLVVVRQQPSVDDGDTVAAVIGHAATVKVFQHRDGREWLIPRNPAHAPIPADNATILGKVVAVIRRTDTRGPAADVLDHGGRGAL
jgi:repressor LexA